MTIEVLAAVAFLGLILAVAIYHFLLYAVLRASEFLSYGAYLLALAVFQLSRPPLASMIAPAIDTTWLFWWSFAALCALGYWLFRSFLDLGRLQPRLNRLFLRLTCAVASASLFVPAMPAFKLVVEVGAFVILVIASIALTSAVRGGVRVARFFGVAYAGLFAGALARAAYTIAGPHLGVVAPLCAFGVEAGSAFQALTLALGLADRIAAANEDRDIAQRRTIDEMRSLNVAYARFVPRAFFELLGASDVRDVALGDGIAAEMTVLFTDVRSFTSISEALTPEETFAFINRLLARTGPIVREHGGIVDKYVGDAIMALFPASNDRALEAAIALAHAVAALNLECDAETPIVVGVGLHRGSVMLGTIGEPERMDGTVIADAVNVASRVEGLTKYFGARIIITEAVRAALDDPQSHAMRYLGRVAMQGKRHGVGVFEVIDGDSPANRASKIATLPAFDAAVRDFVNGRFDDAARGFEAIIVRDAHDGAARYLASRALDLAVNAVAWEGVDRAAK